MIVALWICGTATVACTGTDVGAPPTGTDPPDTTDTSALPSPTADPSDPLDEYRRRCVAETKSLDEAEVRFEDTISLTAGETTQFEVVIQPPSDVPTPSVAPSQGRVRIVCTVAARLVAPSGGVVVTPDDWQTDKYLPPEPTTWTWVVRATSPGEGDALLQLRPAILVDKGDGPVQEADLETVEFGVGFDVDRSASDTAGIAWEWLAGAVAFIAAVIGIPAAYRSWRPRQERAAAPSKPRAGHQRIDGDRGSQTRPRRIRRQ